MCKIFSEIDPSAYTTETRSVRIAGHATSIRLEAAFWETLDQIAAAQGVTVGRFLTKLHDEVLDLRGDVTNFASLLRCACLVHASAARPAAGQTERLMHEAAADFMPAM